MTLQLTPSRDMETQGQIWLFSDLVFKGFGREEQEKSKTLARQHCQVL